MNKYQKRINKITNILLDDEVFLYGSAESFYKMRKFVKKEILNHAIAVSF